MQGILGADREDHSQYRRLLSHAFSGQGLREQEFRINHYVDLLMTGLANHSLSGTQDMVSWFNWTTFDLIGDLAFGESFGCLENARTHPWISEIFGSLASGPIFAAVESYGLMPIFSLLIPKKRLQARLDNYKYASDMVDKRVIYGRDRGDFFDNVPMHDPEKGGMTLDELKSNASNIVLAGSETTATLLSGTVYQLLMNPGIMSKVVEEVRSSFTDKSEITINNTAYLTYLLAVFNETMRIYPPVPSFAPRYVPEGGDTVDGKFLPGGTSVHMLHSVIYKLEANFARPCEFVPERWLDDKPPEFANDNKEVFQPFNISTLAQGIALARTWHMLK